MTVLDTDTLSLLELSHERVSRLTVERGAVSITIGTRLEKLRGRIDAALKAETSTRLIQMQDRLAETERFLVRFPVLPFDLVAAGYFDRLSRVKPTRSMGRADLLIACIALAHSPTLLTRDRRDFAPVPNLRTENWSDGPAAAL